jgi:hypothetical protein
MRRKDICRLWISAVNSGLNRSRRRPQRAFHSVPASKPWHSLAHCHCLPIAIAMLRVDRYVCMGCQSAHGTSSSGYFPTWKAAACHYARTPLCQQTGQAIKLVTVQSRPCDRDAGARGSDAAGQWEPQRPSFWHGVASSWHISYDIPHDHQIYPTIA